MIQQKGVIHKGRRYREGRGLSQIHTQEDGLVGCLTSHSTHCMSFRGRLKLVSRQDQACIPPEPLHHVTIIQL